MISANVKKFLDLVFASQAYANMPQEYKRGYSNLAANGLLDKKQAAWREADANLKKMESSGLDMDGIKYTFSSAELDELYALLLEMFRSMDANRTSFQKNKEANKFFDDNFGYSPAVPPVPKMFRAFEPDIKQLKSLGSTITSTTGKTDLELVFDQMKSVNPLSFGLSKNDFDKFTDSFYKPSTKTLNLIQLDSLKNKRMRDIFLSAIGAARQNINEIHSLLMDFQHAEADLLKAKRATKNITEQKMREILDKLNNVSRTTTPGVRYNRNDLGAASANIAEDLKNMIIVMDAANSINGALLTDVADKPNAFSIADAKKLLSSISKNAEIRDVAISNMQDPTFQRAVYNAERDNNYKDGENRIVPQYDDKKRFWDNAKAKIQDKAERHIGGMFKNPLTGPAQAVADQIKKSGFSQKDGLKGLLAKSEGIKAALPAVSLPIFKSMEKWLKPLADTTQFKEALTHGSQLNHLVKQINVMAAAEAAKESDPEKHSAIMENAMAVQSLLDGMAMGTTGSLVREAFNSNKINVGTGTGFDKFAGGIPNKLVSGAVNLAASGAFEIGNLVKNTVRGNNMLAGPNRKMNEAKEIEALDRIQAEISHGKNTDYRKLADTARRGWEAAVAAGGKLPPMSSGKVWTAKELEKEMNEFELLADARDMHDDRSGAPAGALSIPGSPLPGDHKSKLELQMRLDAHWDMLRSKDGGGRMLSFGDYRAAGKKFHADKVALGAPRITPTGTTVAGPQYEYERNRRFNDILGHAFGGRVA